MKIATLATGLVITALVMAAAISSTLALIIRTGPYASNLTPTRDHSLGLKQVLLIQHSSRIYRPTKRRRIARR
jgi:hypothetical protein